MTRGGYVWRRAQEAELLDLTRQQVEVAAVRDAQRTIESRPERVYFFAAGHAVKVGRSINPEKRVRSFGKILAPEGVDLTAGHLLGTIPGGCHVETALHRQFHRHRLVGEWFSLEPIREQIEGLIAGAEERAA